MEPAHPATAWSFAAPAWSSTQQIPPQRGVPIRRTPPAWSFAAPSVEFPPADPSSVESRGYSVEFPSAEPLQRGASRLPAWSSRQQIPPQRGVPRLQRGVHAGRPRHSVEFRRYSVEFTPADPATAWSSAATAWSSHQQIPPATAWSSAPTAWSSRQQTPPQRGVPRLQRGVPASRPRHSVEFRGYSVEFTPADPATAWSSRLQRGVHASRPRHSVEFRATAWSSRQQTPPAWSSQRGVHADPATAWSPAATAWSSHQQTPPQRGVPRLQRGVHASRPRHSVEFLQRGVQQIPPQRGVPRLQRGVHAGRPRHSVEFRAYSVEFTPTDPATAWSSAPPAWSSHQQTPPAWSSAATAWSSRQQTPPQRGVPPLQRGVHASRPRHSVEFRGYSHASRPRHSVEFRGSASYSVEFTPADPATAWSSAATAWSSRQQTPPQRGVPPLQRGVSAWSSAATAWSSRQQTPPQRGVPRLQRGVHASRPRYSVEFRGYSVEFTPADPATAWSSAATAWSSRQQTPPQRGVPRYQRGVHASRQRGVPRLQRGRHSRSRLQRGVPRLQRGVHANRSPSSVEFRGYSVEFTPTDPPPAWSSAATAWSSRQQTPLLRGVPRLQRGAGPGRPRYSVELGGSSVELAPADPATAWSWAASAWSG